MPVSRRGAAAISAGVASLLAAACFGWSLQAQAPDRPQRSPASSPRHRAVVNEYCLTCHDADHEKGGLELESILGKPVAEHPAVWEKVVRKLRARQMPPVGKPRPDDATYDAVVASLESSLDRAAAAHPNPGRTATIRRLTRTEYRNADPRPAGARRRRRALLPADESSYGFDNVTVGDLSPTLLDRYLSAAEKISRLAVGRAGPLAWRRDDPRARRTSRRKSTSTACRSARAAARSSRYTFPQDGEYEIQIRLTRDRDEHVEGLSEPHEVELLLDRDARAVVHGATAAAGDRSARADGRCSTSTCGLRSAPARMPSASTFLEEAVAAAETARQPYQAHFNSYRHPRLQPAIYSVSIIGPYGAGGPGRHAEPAPHLRVAAGRRSTTRKQRGARQILATLMRRAYRRPVTDADLERPAGALSQGTRRRATSTRASRWRWPRVLVSPQFLFRVETRSRRPRRRHALSHQRSRAGVAAVVLPLEQHSGRRAARRRDRRARCSEPAVLERQVRRMLADDRVAGARDQLRGAVAAPAQPRRDHAGHAAVPGLRRQPAPGVPAGDGALLRQHPARGSQRARSAARRLHVPQRAAGEALRHPARVRQPLPPRRRSTTTASAAACSATAAS